MAQERGMTGRAFRINPAHDAAALGQMFARTGRLHIPDFLEGDGARLLHDWLSAQEAAWRRVISAETRIFEMTRAEFAAMPAETRAGLDTAIVHAARQGFQFAFETIRVPDEEGARDTLGRPVDAFATFLGAPETLAFLRTVTRCADIAIADAQGTCFQPGDVLTGHDDNVAGKGRRAAYVLSLTPVWRIEWGGLLLFHGADGHVDEGYAPRFNSLNLFRVPCVHSVSQVTPFAAEPRYSITGWLRAAT